MGRRCLIIGPAGYQIQYSAFIIRISVFFARLLLKQKNKKKKKKMFPLQSNLSLKDIK